ncbi:hypothetical protein KIL84_014991 [Mauremys mutica]|uniref:Uncharacterized protein n=1 Tax=Mauremys mutica TaxID=74926 RepID=A0A9D3XSE3_9SAUR|nr:hypothetical protein KIL84_014991 [Mauremys mutica]
MAGACSARAQRALVLPAWEIPLRGSSSLLLPSEPDQAPLSPVRNDLLDNLGRTFVVPPVVGTSHALGARGSYISSYHQLWMETNKSQFCIIPLQWQEYLNPFTLLA